MNTHRIASVGAFGVLSMVLVFPAIPQTATAPSAATGFYNVRSFGASGDGNTLDTSAISNTIRAANSAGGGTVIFPAGRYRTGTFELLSNVTLELQPGAVIQGSKNIADYATGAAFGFGKTYGVDSSGEGSKAGLIVARNAENVSIVGRGTIDGSGDYFFDFSKSHNASDFEARYTRQGKNFDNPQYGSGSGPVEVGAEGRPGTMIVFSNCKNVLVRDVTLGNAPNWTLHLQGSDNAVISGIHILNNALLPNNDGVDCMRCRNVHISDCDIRTGDDDFTIVGSDDVQVTNCSLSSHSAAVRLEDTRDSTFDNLSIHANRGLAIFGRGDEHTRHILFSNITLQTHLITGRWWGKAEPIYIAIRSGTGGDEISDVRFTNISAEAEGGIMILGAPGGILRDLAFDEVKLRIASPAPKIARSVGGNFDLRWTATRLSDAIFSHDIPGIYCRYIDRLRIRGLELSWGDNLPLYFSNAIDCEDFHHLDIADFEGRQALVASTAATILLRDGEDVSIRDSRASKGTGLFLQMSEVKGQRLFAGNDLSDAQQAFEPRNPHFVLFGNDMPGNNKKFGH
jgi:hypothetical protein